MKPWLCALSLFLVVGCTEDVEPLQPGPDASIAASSYAITSLSVEPCAVALGGSTTLQVSLAALGGQALSAGQLAVRVVPPSGAERAVTVSPVELAGSEQRTVSQALQSLDQLGGWSVFVSLLDASGQLLAAGPEEGVGLTVNPVNPATSCDPACGGETPDCDPDTLTCACNAGSCASGNTCDARGACVLAGCNPACGGETPVCNSASNQCQCGADSCAGGATCAAGACTAAGETRTLAEIVDAAGRVKAFCQSNVRLPNYVTMGTVQVAMPSFLKLVVEATLALEAGQTGPLALPSGIAAPAAIEDDTIPGQIPRAEYLALASEVQTALASGTAPGSVSSSLGAHLGFTNLVYLFSKIVAWSGANGLAMPNYVTLDIFSKAAVTNPLSPVVGYQQINLTSDWGSCGSHSGGVGIAYLRGFSTVAEATAVENDLYYSYGGKVYGGPGRSDLADTYNRYLDAKGVGYTAYLFTDSDAVLGLVNAGTPVVAHVTLWGGHYVCIYGLVEESGTWKVYFSDGAYSDGVSATLPTGYLKKWSWSTFKTYLKSGYIGFKRK